MKDLPNMAQKELGSTPQNSPSISSSSSSAAISASISPSITISSSSGSPISLESDSKAVKNSNALEVSTNESSSIIPQSHGQAPARKALSWGQMIWEKWYWGILIAVALAVSSRVTGNS